MDSPPIKKARPSIKKQCVICLEKDELSELSSPKDLASWKTLLDAAQTRQWRTVSELEVTDISDLSKILYHRNCRSVFTLKRDIEKLKASKQQASSTESAESSSEGDRFLRSDPKAFKNDSNLLRVECIFCEKGRYVRGTHTRERLVKCTDLRVDDTLRNCTAEKLQDGISTDLDRKIIKILSSEVVASEAHYHRTCYREYTDYTSKKRRSSNTGNLNEPNQEACSEPVQEAFSMLHSFIQERMIENQEVLSLSSITSQLTTYLHDLGVIEVQNIKNNIRRSLDRRFNQSIHFLHASDGKVYVYPDSLRREDILKWNIELQNEVKKQKSDEANTLLHKVALMLRQEIRQVKTKVPWPPHPDEVGDPEYLTIPESVQYFLRVLLTGSEEQSGMSARSCRTISSMAQDLVFAISCQRVKPAKHIQLASAVKTLTGNTEVICFLNRNNQCISYSQLEELDTALCLHKLSLNRPEDVPIPASIFPRVPTTLGYDNIDRNEETLSGGSTSHRVNGVIIQPVSLTPKPLRPYGEIEKSKKRSIAHTPEPLPPYNAGTRVGPPKPPQPVIETQERFTKMKLSNRKNRVWSFMRMRDSGENQKICSWTGFNIQTRNSIDVKPDEIAYLPTINAPATELSTLKEVLEQSENIRITLDLKEIALVFDQAMYAKAAEVAWKNQKIFGNIILRMGEFHTINVLHSIIGCRFKDAGLRDLAVEANVIAEGSIDKVLEGKMYNRATRFYKLLYEALLRLGFKSFLQWREEHHNNHEATLKECFDNLDHFKDDVSQAGFDEVLNDPSCKVIFDEFDEFVNDHLRTKNGDLSSFWVSCLELIEIMLALLRASREGDWLLHMAAIRALIAWCFQYDKQNYARYLTAYYRQMLALPVSHPETYQHFLKGGFSVQIGKSNPFGKIPVDQAVEETVNKDTQTPGGTKGFSLKPAALSRFYLTAEFRSAFLKQMRASVSLNTTFHHADLSKARTKRDEIDVTAMVELLESSWINPFDLGANDLVCLSTGVAAPKDVCEDLLSGTKKGEAAYQKFCKERFESNPPKADFHDKISRTNLKGFGDLVKKTKTSTNGHEVILKADHRLFSHMLLIADKRKLDMKDVLSHPLGPLPWSISNPDGTLRKTKKSTLSKNLEGKVSPAEEILQPSACILDGMAILQKFHGDGKTFGEISKEVLGHCLTEGFTSERIDIVFDVYKKDSIKNLEREQRGSGQGVQYKSIQAKHKVTQWRRCLASPESKSVLPGFFLGEWKTPDCKKRIGKKQLYVTVGGKCFKISENGCCEIPSLETKQEEADTRMLLHANSVTQRSAILVADDADILLLALAFSDQISCNLYVKCGNKSRARYIDVGKLARAISEKTSPKALIGMHSFTGCDTVSAFGGKGKMSSLKLIEQQHFKHAMEELGEKFELSELSQQFFSEIQEFTCRMYAANSNINTVNELRYGLFKAKKGDIESGQLPPCEDALLQHTIRANYQAGIWRRSLEQFPTIPDAIGHGWVKDGGKIAVNWIEGKPAPDTVLQLLSCKCSRSCKLPSCPCMSNGLRCTDACKLTTCANMAPEEEVPNQVMDPEFEDEED